MLGFKHAFRGLFRMFSQERNFKIQFVIFVLVILLAFLLEVSRNDWVVLLLVSALVISLETINSAIEKACDLYSTERNEQIKNIKDISAGAVLISALFAIVIGILIFLPYLNF